MKTARQKRAADGNAAPKADAPAQEAPADAAADGKKPVSPLRAGLDFFVMLGGAVAIALIIKAYAFDVYLIPSGSMETALHGRPDGGDRIFCSKLNYRFRQPERWEVAVFEFPYESARRSDPRNTGEQYKGQNFVKRIVGLPGESLAIAKGDIWTRSASGAAYERMVKPDSVQRGMWLQVYEEDFRDLSRDELAHSWRVLGEEVGLTRGGPLRLSPGDGTVRLEYRPRTPVGGEERQMVELPGIPDRYALDQPVQFRCRNLVDGEPCGHLYVKATRTQTMLARCPRCGSLQDESAAVFYHRRSGLPSFGRYAADPRQVKQGEEALPRQSDYHFVPDLRVVADAALTGADARFAVTLGEDSRFIQAIVHGNGQVEVEINGETSRPEHRALAAITPGRNHRIEFYVVEGTARLFVDSAETPLLDVPVWRDRRPQPRALPRASGVGLAAAGGDVVLHRLAIDRDIFYYSGWEHERGEKFGQIGAQGEIFVDSDSFFPMGDHAPSSYDARSWGPVSLSLLRGPALLIWWPPERIGLIRKP